MKVATVKFKLVRDCPFYLDGECIYMERNSDFCNKDEISLPPGDCTLPESRE